MRGVRLEGVGLEKRFGRVAALRGVDLEVRPGESLAVLGANGAGKSTLLRILAGLSRPSAGRFEAHLADAADPLSRERLRGHVGYVGHASLLYGELTARENLAFAARLHGAGTTDDALDSILGPLGLLDVADRRAGTFSRGMTQRLAIARAIVHDPDVLLLDEPFTGLDEVSARRLSGRLGALRERGHSLVLITHDPRRAIELAERGLVLHRGRVRARLSAGADFELEALREILARLGREEEADRAA
ncbi:MAG: heme ABC exporter ATP-binding protein CcmA [Spirochaetaceae bacterium]|nr:heme ABC exporter ATP-binding protein CcmA [Myxococcales bacterium]MCB9724520.1 heme ABC exporter ATP-binding protein CcmA [Spirochaetaceae bacterium]HPG27914.1 heme ABC exporter ATP-binding protein CcmA [Myxococcota bacterium]